MSECDKTKIVGYVEQSQAQIEWINQLKTKEIELVSFLDYLMAGETKVNHIAVPTVDKRWMSIAKTHIQQGFMAAVRAVARPNGD